MWHEPRAVDGVAAEAAGEVIVDATLGHRVERLERHRARLRISRAGRAAQEQQRLGSMRELRRTALAAPEALVPRIEVRGALLDEGREERLARLPGDERGRSKLDLQYSATFSA